MHAHFLFFSRKLSKTFSMKVDLGTKDLAQSKSDNTSLSSEIETPFFVNNIIYVKVIISLFSTKFSGKIICLCVKMEVEKQF